MVKYARIESYCPEGFFCGYCVKAVSKVEKDGYILCSDLVYDAFTKEVQRVKESKKFANPRYHHKMDFILVSLNTNIQLSDRIVDGRYVDWLDCFITMDDDDYYEEDFHELNEIRQMRGIPICE